MGTKMTTVLEIKALASRRAQTTLVKVIRKGLSLLLTSWRKFGVVTTVYAACASNTRFHRLLLRLLCRRQLPPTHVHVQAELQQLETLAQMTARSIALTATRVIICQAHHVLPARPATRMQRSRQHVRRHRILFVNVLVDTSDR
jgi:hypothetical protein